METNTNEEMLCVFGEDGRRLEGQYVPRSVAHRDGIRHGASHIFIYRSGADGPELLLQRRSPNKDSFPGCLDISSAGHMKAGSDFLATALEELSEELGIEAKAEQLFEAFTMKFENTSIAHGREFRNREIDRVYLLKLDVDPAALVLQKEEVSEALWLPLNEIAARLTAGDRELCLDPNEFERVAEAIYSLESVVYRNQH